MCTVPHRDSKVARAATWRADLCLGLVVPWFGGALVGGALVLVWWWLGLVVPWFGGALVWWCLGLAVPWFGGALVWCWGSKGGTCCDMAC